MKNSKNGAFNTTLQNSNNASLRIGNFIADFNCIGDHRFELKFRKRQSNEIHESGEKPCEFANKRKSNQKLSSTAIIDEKRVKLDQNDAVY